MSEATFGAYTLMRAAIGDDAAQAATRERIRAAQ
jgi:hypothetical protein